MRFESVMLKKSMSALSVLLAMCVVLCGCGNKTEEVSTQETVQAQQDQTVATEETAKWELAVESVEDQENNVVVTTSAGQIKYPFAFADLIQVKATNEETVASLEFSALIAGEEYPLYALYFGDGEGIALGTMEIPEEGEPRHVYAAFYPADEASLGDNLGTFHAVQETFNDVVASLNENQSFVQAK